MSDGLITDWRKAGTCQGFCVLSFLVLGVLGGATLGLGYGPEGVALIVLSTIFTGEARYWRGIKRHLYMKERGLQ